MDNNHYIQCYSKLIGNSSSSNIKSTKHTSKRKVLLFPSKHLIKSNSNLLTIDTSSFKSPHDVSSVSKKRKSDVYYKNLILINNKIESTIEKINKKQKTILQHQQKTQTEQAKEKEKLLTRNVFRNLKRKIFKLVTTEPLLICQDFHRSNTMYNQKFLSYLNSPSYYSRSNQYQQHFHFHTNGLSANHSQFNMLIDEDKFKQGLLYPHQVLKKKLTEEDVKLVKQDPLYFLRHNSELIQRKEYHMELLYKQLNNGQEEYKENAKPNKKEINSSRKCILNEKQLSHKVFNPIFNWTEFDKKIAHSIYGLNKHLNKSYSMKEFRTLTQPEMSMQFKHQIDKDLTSIYKYKKHKTKDMKVNYNLRLPVNQQRVYLNYEVKKRLKMEAKKYKERQESLILKNNNDYLLQIALDRIRDNIINKKSSPMSTSRFQNGILFKSKSSMTVI